MLYDPKWEQPSLTGFTAWLEQQPGDIAYDFSDPFRCPLAKYLGHMCSYGEEITIVGRLQHRIISERPWTYAGVLERIRAEQAR